MDEKESHHIADGVKDPAANYSAISVLAHWLGAIAVIALFVTHEDEWLNIHVSVGLILTLPLLARVIYRWFTGFPRPVDQHPSLNLLSRLVMIGMLLAILVTSITGLLLPLFAGEPYPMFEFGEWSAPYSGNRLVHFLLEAAHDAAGHAILPLFALHMIGFLKHLLLTRHGNRWRMLKPIKGGK